MAEKSVLIEETMNHKMGQKTIPENKSNGAAGMKNKGLKTYTAINIQIHSNILLRIKSCVQKIIDSTNLDS